MSMGDVEKRGVGGGGGNDNEYVTFQEMMTQDNKLHIKQQPLPPRPTTPAGLNKSQIKSLQVSYLWYYFTEEKHGESENYRVVGNWLQLHDR